MHRLLRHASGEKTPVTIDASNEMASGPNVDTFSIYLGVVACERISILTNSWDNVTEVDQIMLLEDVYNIIVIIYCFLILIDQF